MRRDVIKIIVIGAGTARDISTADLYEITLLKKA